MVKVFCISLEFCSALQLCIVAKGKGELRMKKEWVKLKTAVNMAAAMEVLTFVSFVSFLFCLFCLLFFVFCLFFVFFCFVMAASTSPFYHQYQLHHHHHHHYHHHDDHHYQGDKEESDEDEEIYVIEPKPEPKFRHQIFRDKERVIHNNNVLVIIVIF